jgi:peptidoglycan hydrolase-like protein with peptidoglycan-binding domain
MLAVVAMIAGAASARAGTGTGGFGTGGSGGTGGGGGGSDCPKTTFGKRTLELGDCGVDVTTLNWVLKSKRFRVPLEENFKSKTDRSVRAFQRKTDLRSDGVVNERTSDTLRNSLRHDWATWYGPGLYGNNVACGGKLRRDTMGVANRSLPCGTKVVIGWRGRWVRTKVIDRGPYAKGTFGKDGDPVPTAKHAYRYDWDMTQRVAHRLHMERAGIGHVRVGVIR